MGSSGSTWPAGAAGVDHPPRHLPRLPALPPAGRVDWTVVAIGALCSFPRDLCGAYGAIRRAGGRRVTAELHGEGRPRQGPRDAVPGSERCSRASGCRRDGEEQRDGGARAVRGGPPAAAGVPELRGPGRARPGLPPAPPAPPGRPHRPGDLRPGRGGHPVGRAGPALHRRPLLPVERQRRPRAARAGRGRRPPDGAAWPSPTPTPGPRTSRRSPSRPASPASPRPACAPPSSPPAGRNPTTPPSRRPASTGACAGSRRRRRCSPASTATTG